MSTLRRYLAFLPVYRREAATVRDFVRLLRVRLSQSKLGPLVCPRPIAVDVNLRSLGGPVRLRSHTTDISVLGELLVGGSYDAAAAAAGSAKAIVDLGGNTGLAARWLLRRFPDAVLVSVEPDPENFAVLAHNLAGRGKALHAFAGGTRRKASVSSGTDEDAHRLVDDPAGRIEVLDMPAILAQLGATDVDLLKVDIEGSERELFAHCGAWIGRTRIASVECHGDYTIDSLVGDLRANRTEPVVLARSGDYGYGYETVLLQLVSPPGA